MSFENKPKIDSNAGRPQAVLVNKFTVAVGPVFARLSFAEEFGEGTWHRQALAMSLADARALARCLLTLLPPEASA